MIYLRAPGVDGLCHDCDPDDPCAGGGIIYLPCGNQCGVPGVGDDPVILPLSTTSTYALVERNGVKAVYYRDVETSDAANATVVPGTPPTGCPSSGSWNHCFTACCTGSERKAIIISDAQFVSLFPGDPNNPSAPTAGLCVVLENCYFCNHSYVRNPVTAGMEGLSAGVHQICDNWLGEYWPDNDVYLCNHCCDCGDCVPRLNGSFTVTFAGLAGGFSYINGSNTLKCAGGCLWKLDENNYGGRPVIIELIWSAGAWMISVYESSNYPNSYSIVFTLAADACSPSGSYTQTSCSSPYSDACDLSSGATCVLS